MDGYFCRGWMVILMMIITEICQTRGVNNSLKNCCKKSGNVLDCTNCNLQSIATNNIDENISDLLLANNNISRIPEDTFGRFESLRRLTLTDNPLTELARNSFRGLDSLEHLEIGSTTMESPPQISPDVLSNTKDIKRLVLYYNYPTELPTGCLSRLKKLETLEIGLGEGALLGDEFKSLGQLKSLRIIHLRNTSAHQITGKTFASVPLIEELQMTRVLKSVASDSFVHFTRLSTLSLLCNIALNISDVMNAIKHMTGPTLRRLILDGSDNLDFYNLTPTLVNSTNFANITHLSLKRTHMGAMDPNFMYMLPSLKFLSVGYNSILTTKQFRSGYQTWQSIENIQVESLDVSHLNQRTLPEIFYDGFCRNSLNTFRTPPDFVRPPKKLDLRRTFVLPGDTRKLFMPQSLLYFYADHFGWLIFQGSAEKPLVVNHNNIIYLDLSSSNLQSLVLVKGYKKLQALDLTNNRIQFLHVDQLFHFPELSHLNLRSNDLSSMNLTALFAGGSKLEWLDLGHNALKNLPTNLLMNLKSLKSVSFRGNPSLRATLNLNNNLKLEKMDLSSCALTNLTEGFLKQLDNLQDQLNHTLSLNVSNNAFKCTCETAYMVNWFKNSDVNLNDRESINCEYGSRKVPITKINVDNLLKKCSGKHTPWSVIISTPIIIFTLMIFVSVVTYRFRWHLKWHVFRIRRTFRNVMSKSRQDIPLNHLERQFDAFVSYNHDVDYEWVINELMAVVEKQWGFKLCISQRDFIVGAPIVENILNAIDNSRKTVLVVTRAFAESEWCEFEMQMALIKSRQNVVIVYKENIPVEAMSNTLRTLVRSVNYIEYNQDPAGLRTFWERLRTSLGS